MTRQQWYPERWFWASVFLLAGCTCVSLQRHEALLVASERHLEQWDAAIAASISSSALPASVRDVQRASHEAYRRALADERQALEAQR